MLAQPLLRDAFVLHLAGWWLFSMRNHDTLIRALSRALPFLLLGCGSNDSRPDLKLDAGTTETHPDVPTGWDAEPDARQSLPSFDGADGLDDSWVSNDGGSDSPTDSSVERLFALDDRAKLGRALACRLSNAE